MSDFFFLNMSFLTGGSGEVFLDASDFRSYLNKYFKVGETHSFPCGDGVHWVFVDQHGMHDSIDKLYQPCFDYHCTMFSLYEELLAYGYNLPRLVALEGKNDRHVHYLRNLIKIYRGLRVMLSDPGVVKYIYKFKPWKTFGEYIPDLIKAINSNLVELKNMIAVESISKRPYELKS